MGCLVVASLWAVRLLENEVSATRDWLLRAALITILLGVMVHALYISGYLPSLTYSGGLYSGGFLLSALIVIFVALASRRRNRRITANFSAEERDRWYARRDRSNGLGGMVIFGLIMFFTWHGTRPSDWHARLEVFAACFLDSMVFWLYGTWRLRQINTPQSPGGSLSGIGGSS